MKSDLSKIAEYEKRIKNDFPGLALEKVVIIGSGWHHDAIEVNDSIIFRIPRGVHDLHGNSVRFETEVLKSLAGKLPVEIPDPKYIAPDNTYFGYPKLEGEVLNTILPAFSEEDRANFREDWVNIAVAIHKNISVEVAKVLGVPHFSESGSRITSAASRIFALPNISAEVLDFSKRVINEISEVNPYSQPQTVIHNDLQSLNLLVDPKTKRVCAVIDWTDICIGPLAREFSAWAWDYNNQIEQVAALYQQKTGIAIDVRQARLWRYVGEISDLVEEAENGNLEAVNDSARHIIAWAEAF